MAMAMLVATVATSLLSAKQKRDAGAIAKSEAEVSAKSEELGAVQRAADRKERLVSALATQTASAAGGGISAFEGSPLSALQESISAEETATERDTFNTRLSALTTRTRGSVAKSQANTAAAVGLIGSLGKAGATYGATK